MFPWQQAFFQAIKQVPRFAVIVITRSKRKESMFVWNGTESKQILPKLLLQVRTVKAITMYLNQIEE